MFCMIVRGLLKNWIKTVLYLRYKTSLIARTNRPLDIPDRFLLGTMIEPILISFR